MTKQATAPPWILMLGTSPEERGGIAAVVRTLLAAGLEEQWRVRYIRTHAYVSGPAKLRIYLKALVQALWLVIGRRPLLAHIHVASNNSFWRKAAFIWLFRAAGLPVLLHIHGGQFHRFASPQAGRLRYQLIRATLRQAKHLILLSTQHESLLAHLLIRPHSVLPNAVLIPAAEAQESREPLILFLGHLHEAKGVHELLRAFAQVHARHPELRLVLAGFGPERERLSEEARRLGLVDAVRLAGWVDADERNRLLGRCLTLVLPSHIEGLPVSLLEAMAQSVPVVATPVGGVPELVQDGETGLLVAPGDDIALALALERLVTDAELARRLGRQGREFVQCHHDARRAVVQLGGIYARFLEEDSR